MNRRSYLLVFLICSAFLSAQDIKRFHTTDSSVIETRVSYIGKLQPYLYKYSIEKFRYKDLVRETGYFHDTLTVQYVFNKKKNGAWCGISKTYNKDGSLKNTFDWDHELWIPSDTGAYPNYAALNNMKLKGDSLLSLHYGKTFFRKYLTWDIYQSYYFNKDYTVEPSFSMEWTREGTRRGATECYLAYDLYYEGEWHDHAVRIILDEQGNLLPEHSWNENWTIHNEGVEVLSDTNDVLFDLTKEEALRLAGKSGLKDTAKAYAYLFWHTAKDTTIAGYNDRFLVKVSEFIPASRKQKRKAPTVSYWKIWVFDPRTKQLIAYWTEQKSFDRIFGG